jgi:hypothetical protein
MKGIDVIAAKHHVKPTNRNKAAIKDFLNVVEEGDITMQILSQVPRMIADEVRDALGKNHRKFRFRGDALEDLFLLNIEIKHYLHEENETVTERIEKIGHKTIASIAPGTRLNYTEFDAIFHKEYLQEVGPFTGSGMPGRLAWAMHHRQNFIKHLQEKKVMLDL